MHRQRGTVPTVVTVLHTALLPTASSTGTRNTGLLWPLASTLPQPTTALLTVSSTVYQTCPQLEHRRFRVTRSASCPFVAIAVIRDDPHAAQSNGAILLMYPATMAQ